MSRRSRLERVHVHVGTGAEGDRPIGLQAVCNPDNPQAEARRAGAYNARLDVTLVKDTEEAYRRYSARIPDGATAKEIESLHARFIAEVSYLADQNAAAKAAVPTNPELRKAYDEAYGPKFTYGVAFRLFQACRESGWRRQGGRSRCGSGSASEGRLQGDTNLGEHVTEGRRTPRGNRVVQS